MELNTQKLGGTSGEVPNLVTKLIHKYHSIFKEPKSLPPMRGIYDHRIPLKHRTNTINIRP